MRRACKCCEVGASLPQFTVALHNVSKLPSPDLQNKHSNFQYQFLSISPFLDAHKNHSNIQYQFLSTLPSPDPNKKRSNIQYQFLSIFPSPDPHNKHSNIQYHFLSLQIRTTRLAIKNDCVVGVTAVGYTCSCILKLKLTKYHSRCSQKQICLVTLHSSYCIFAGCY